MYTDIYAKTPPQEGTFQELDLSGKKRLFFVGDLHGEYDALMYALDSVGFSESDALISVGDVIDRGPKSLESLLFFKYTDNAYMAKGNHEDFFAKSYADNDRQSRACWLWNGGQWCQDLSIGIAMALAKWCKALPTTLTVTHKDTVFGVCHAQSATNSWLDNGEHPCYIDDILWERERIEDPESSVGDVTFTIHGHTPKDTVTINNNQYWIDTNCQEIRFLRGCLTLLEWDGELLEEHRFEYDRINKQYRMVY